MNAIHFTRSKLADIMSYEAFKELDKVCQAKQLFPENAKIKTGKYFSGRKTNLLTNVCLRYLQWKSYHAERVNTTGQMRKVNGEMKYTYSGSTKGSADLHCIIEGMPVQIEIKYGSDKLSEAQLKYKKKIEAAGGKYFEVKTFDDLLDIIVKITKK